MNNRWKMNRIGFINFWLYDEEIFNLENGKILIRGTNGSGKSITTQSVVSFILDGDRSPGRLDTFGSNDRKMEYYFLGDGEKEDETGYIFLELKKENVEQYITIGIGQRAQKGKPMSFWGFVLSDGRRVGEEFKLYREIGNKRIPLSKNELERLLGDKNKIAYGQRDYMDMVNKELFGFSDISYYKKLIKFLLKIRTSKLSTDIKPMNVYEILNDSLQVLEERDLRVLVESLEKMDNMQKRNEEQKEVQKSINIIKREYDKYNKFILEKKATTYFEAKKEYEILKKTIDKLIKEIEKLKKESKDNSEIKVKIEKRIEEIEQENRILESIDLEKIVNEMLITKKELQSKEKEIKDEEEKLEEHNTELKKQEIRKREEENRIESIKYKIKKLYQELKDINEMLMFEGHLKDENEIFQKEIVERLETIKNNLEVYQKNINLGLEALKKMEILSEALNKEEKEINNYRNENNRIENEMLKALGMEERARDTLVENFYILKEKNEFLKISKNDLDKIIELIKKYEGLIEAGEIKKILEKNYNLKNQEFQHTKLELEHIKKLRIKEYEIESKELEQLKNMEDSVPIRKDKVIQCREELKKSGIEFMAFYETVDFAERLSEIEKNILEAQLKDSGILDSLVIPYEKREKAKSIISKYSDIIITNQKNSGKNFKYNKLVVENISENVKEVIEDFFKNISSMEQEKNEDTIILGENGYFKNGVLEGYSSSNEEASFIGVQTRKEKLQKSILEKEAKCTDLLYKIENIDFLIEEVSNKILVLVEEYKNIPIYDDLDTSIKLRKDTEYAFQKIKNELEIKEDKLNKIKIEYGEWNQKVITRCRILPFEKKITEYEEAEIALKEYMKNIYELENQLRNYQSSKYEIIRTEEMKEKEEELIEFYNDKIRKGKNELEKYQKAIEKLQEILNSPENVAAAEKLKNLKEEKSELKEQYDKADRNIIRIDTTIQGKEEILNSENEKVEAKERAVEKTFEYYKEEISLRYVVQYETGEEEKILKEILENIKDNEKTIESVTISLMKKFNDNSSRLYEYMAATEEIFEEDSEYCRKRIYIRMSNNGKKLSLYEFEKVLKEEIEEREYAIEREDRKLIVDILSGNIGHKLNDQIYESRKWIKEMSKIMSEMETSMKMRFSMEWKPKEKLNESELEINELEKLLRQDGKLLSAEDLQKISEHFKSKLNLIREEMEIKGEEVNYIDSIREILDYRKWFEFKIYYQREGENKKELTNNAFNRFSGGEKAMSIYIPLLAAASAQYKKAKEDCPRIIALDEAFAGIDDKNISSMFELIDKLDFDYIMNSQILWGCYETVKKLRIAELINRRDLKMVKVNYFYWDGKKKNSGDVKEQILMLDECIRYFKENKGYKRIFYQMRNKYISYGKLSGNIIIDNPEKIELEAVRGLLGRVVEGNKIKFKISEFEKVLKESRFREIELIELLEGYFSESLITKKEKKLEKEVARELFFTGIRERLKITGEYNKTAAELLEKIIRDKGSFYKHDTDNIETENMIYFTIKAINFLKKSTNRIKIALLGAKITSNPHYFDRGMPAGQLLLNLLFYIHGIEYTKEAEKVLELYYISGIEIDTISSFTTAFGISLYTEKGIHQAYEEFIKQSEECMITMSNLKKIIKADCKKKKVFIVENQMVFSHLCEYFKDKEVALLCTSGQLKTASLILIDMLCKEGCTLYYSGDIDPEGIEIADKLIQRRGNKIIPWCFTIEDYKLNISKKIISEESIKKLEKIKSDCFIELIEEVKKEKRAGYQELILDKMKEDIKKINWDL